MKIGVIGGAGVRTVIFINGLLKRYRRLHIDEVVLYDTDAEKLAMIGALCRHVVRRAGETLNVRVTDEVKNVVSGMDYIVTTLRVGGDHSRVVDEKVALKNGVIGQETTGVGGFSMAARTIPVLIGYCDLIAECAPQAWVFNFTNPSGLVTQALHTAGYRRVIGICDAPSSMKYRMAHYLNIPEEELYVEFFGLNHLSWIDSIKLCGREILSELLADDAFLSSIQELEVFDKDVIRMTGIFPNEYLYYYYHREKALENITASGVTRGETIEHVNQLMFDELRAMDIDAHPEEALQTFLYGMQLRENSYMSIESGLEKRPILARGALPIPEGMGYAGVMLDCVEGLQSDDDHTLVLNVPNRGTISFLHDEDIIESTCHVTRRGIIPVRPGRVPSLCETYIRLIKRYERLAVKSILEGDECAAIEALALHPLVNSFSLARKLLNDYAEVYGKRLVGERLLKGGN